MLFLSIETSCDETSAAVIESGRIIHANIVASQEAIHAKYGGVFPEVASRRHIEVIYSIVDEAMTQAAVDYANLDGIAVTKGPGLVGSLLVGVNVAKGLALASHKPLLGINHIEGHIYAQWLAEDRDEIEFPILILVVSGGHTELYLMSDHGKYTHLGGTMDDAAGEAFDKVGRLLDLPYPGGPAIDKAAKQGDAGRFRFPRAVLDTGYDFSFSGLKTAVLRETERIKRQQGDDEPLPVADLAAGFQTAVVDALLIKTARAAEAYRVKGIHITGGVSANSELRQVAKERFDVPVRTPPLRLCTDNAAMIGAAAYFRWQNGQRGDLEIDVSPNLPIT